MKMNAYLSFNGTCEAAFRFYEKALGGRIVMMLRNKEAPAEAGPIDPKMTERIMHARLIAGEAVLMGGDAPPEHYAKAQGFCVNISVDTPEEADRVFAALSDGATIRMPIGETFWASRFGMLVDKFGTPWMVNCENRG
jgi:PhnB protein